MHTYVACGVVENVILFKVTYAFAFHIDTVNMIFHNYHDLILG